MLASVLSAVRFLWTSTAGFRLQPWRSPYLRWRLETYTGKPAHALRFRDFLQLAWRERRQLLRFSRWMAEMRRLMHMEAA